MNYHVFVVDEGGQIHKHLMEEFDRKMRDFTGIYQPYGGKYVIFECYWGKTLPIIVKISQATQIKMSLKKSQLWNRFTTYPLYNNKRCPNQHWQRILLQLRSVTYGNSDDGSVQFTENMIQAS